MVKKVVVSPAVCIDHDAKRFTIYVELPGVEKKDIELQMGVQAFCVRGPTKDVEYSACYALAHRIEPRKAKARFENGLLTITTPLKQPLVGTKVPVK